MQLVGHVPYNLAPIISLFLKRDVNKALVGEKEELDMDLRSRVSTSLAQGQTYVKGLASQTMWVPPLWTKALHRQDEEVGKLRHSLTTSGLA